MLHKLFDHRINCLSIMTEMSLGSYIALVEAVYKNNGGLEGQRAPLKTKTAVTIRRRLVEDIRLGAVIPPVVLGAFVEPKDIQTAKRAEKIDDILRIVSGHDDDRISIIDGMQRTTAMLDALRQDASIAERPVRVEFWISEYLNSLVYRMLVLNSGQVPWEIGRQLETVYGQFLKKIRSDLGESVEVFLANSQRRRSQAGQYQSRNIIELLLLFSSRKSEMDFKDRVAEDFARLDAIETTAHNEFIDYFVGTIRMMADLDRAFSRYAGADRPEGSRIRSGRDIFGAFPAMAGFSSAVSVSLFDEPGFQIDWAGAPEKFREISASVAGLSERLSQMDQGELSSFLQADLLEERLSQRSGQVGRFEREFFRKAFVSLFKNSARLSDMTPCWVA